MPGDHLLPEGAVLVHIGPYKTGTTALQAALFAARESFAEHGVYYPGRWRRAMREGWSVLEWSPRGRPDPPPIEFWEAFASDIRDHPRMRTGVSNEDFAAAPDYRAKRIVDDLGGDNVHVLMVLRRFDRLLPSAWQERVKGHDRRTYDQWLHDILENPRSQAHRAFWRAQGIGSVAGNWLPAVDPTRFHVVVTDDSDRGLLLRLFEELLGLPAGLLQPPEAINSSLTANGVELVRRLNEVFAEREWSDQHYHAMIYNGATQALMTGPRTEVDVRIPPVPDWATEPLAALSRERMETLVGLGVDVIGDPATLLLPERAGAGGADAGGTPEVMSLDQAQSALTGAVEGALRLLERQRRRHERELGELRGSARPAGQRPVADLSGRELLREAAVRLSRRVRRG